MHVFDFFAQLTSTAFRPWLFSPFAAPHNLKHFPVATRPTVHDLSFDLELPCSSPTTPATSPTALVSTTRRSAPVHMPLELILQIIEASYDRGHPDISLLKACSLVCREWSVAVQKLLFRKVVLQTLPAFQSFSRAINPSTERGSILGSAVRELRVVVDYSQPSYLHQHAMARAVTMCPNLQELDLSLYGFAEPSGDQEEGSQNGPRLRRRAPCFDEQTLTLLRSGPQITSLSFSNWSENHECIFQLLDVWPSLQSLSMSGTSPHLPSQSSLSYSGALEQLRMNFQTPPSMEFMNWLLHHSTDSLRGVTLERDPCPDLVDFIMDSFTPSLRSLTIPNCTSSDMARRLEKCDGLRFLRMDQPQVNPLVYKSLPASINHLAFGVDRDTPLQPVIDLVKSRSALELVTIRLWNGGDNHRLLPALKIACAYRGVDLRMTNDTLQYDSMLLC
ncbi:hypothetical protein CC1G_00584 [Coprinopsis cinerea okayama7|uniref:Uncharacterized protein n=1 Tax=Coprinopsis cinerea (strain Okayama-7 / 130 / ATCC MYA-4618 / FGSC 9003) TaxID=240176 RepID=A8N3R3_COPC7|nr:hypothetical protein CC1G_00584 [Coprinopsis cinerea okayama7\|eukprot:XP_001829405.1 hypothetical protein CC1G_00584 [Coprinopsis cinerea okayama7\